MKFFNKLNIFVLLLCLFIPLSIAGCENSNKKSLSKPVISEVEGGIIVFNQVPNAEYYTILINNNELNVNISHNQYVEIIDNQINYDASKIFIVGKSYSIKVRANSSKVTGDYSDSYSYKHIGSINDPENLQVSESILTWDAVDNASYYILKVLTPNDNIDMDDNESIENADLTELYYSTNRFNISSLLSTAGEYKFYVCAVLNYQSSILKSDYVSITYNHIINLETPTIGNIYQNNDGIFHTTAVIDSNANAVVVRLNNFEEQISLNELDNSIINKIKNSETEISNFYDINLSNLFKSYIESGEFDVSLLKQFNVSVKAIHEEATTTNFFNDSNFSAVSSYENKLKLSAPTINQLEQVGSNHLVSWTCDQTEIENISEFNLVVLSSDGLTSYSLESQSTSMLITEDFEAVAIQAIGKGNYLSSNFSEFASANTNSLSNISVQARYLSGSDEISISWNSYASAYYILEHNNTYIKLNSNSYLLPADPIDSKNINVRVHVISDGYAPKSSNLITVTQEKNLETPNDLRFDNPNNLYELNFTGCENAIGYYVLIKGNQNFYLVEKLFTTTKIDLTNLICDREVSSYHVKVQAVADPNSKFINSNYSSEITVSHIDVLPAPEFHNSPIATETISGKTLYYLQFKEVTDADKYEILINHNWQQFTKQTLVETGCYDNGYFKVNISNVLVSAKEYTIKIKAIPSDSAINLQASSYNTYTYNLIKQLKVVENIQISEHDGIYTLSFDGVDEAVEYEIRIARENDGDYSTILTTKLTAIDITNEIKQSGKYFFYVTAIAKEGGNYADSQESNALIREKRTTLNSPTDIKYINEDEDEYYITWLGDDHADYYQIKITDTNSLEYEILDYDGFEIDDEGNKRYSANISNYLTVQGTYSFILYSRVTPNSENSKEYTTGEPTEVTNLYEYTLEQDFLRYSVSMYGSEYDFMINDIHDLKNILWYHYLYEMNQSSGLRIIVQPNPTELDSTDSLKRAIIRISIQATQANLYDFTGDNLTTNDVFGVLSEYDDVDEVVDVVKGDPDWYDLIKSNKTETELLKYLSIKLLEIYPELNILEDFSIEVLDQSINSYKLTYKNALNINKVDAPSNLIKDSAGKTIALIKESKINYGKNFNYVSLYARKSADGLFNIDSRPEMLVSTTEQLLHAVQYGYKPKFVGNHNSIATVENVYKNAKLVLSAIVTDSMTDIEKVTAIFDWLEYGFDLTYYDVYKTTSNIDPYVSGTVEKDNISIYGKYKQYYLEGIFENISIDANTGNLVIGNNHATSWSYSKAFALLCGIEGIETITVNGNYEYYNSYKTGTDIADHMWNKIYLSNKWYNVDLTFSDNTIIFTDINNSYGNSSHTYFLVSNDMLAHNIFGQRVTQAEKENDKNIYNTKYLKSDESYLITNIGKDCSYNYDYYGPSTFGLTKNQIMSVTYLNYENPNTPFDNFKYTLECNPKNTYQGYLKNSTLGPAQNYVLNALIYSSYNMHTNNKSTEIFEFKYKWENYGGLDIMNDEEFSQAINSINGNYFYNNDIGYKLNIASCTQTKNVSESETIVIMCIEREKQSA